jgi:hypothetical protein
MKLHEELYFEITVEGAKSDVVKFIDYVKSGELDDFFEFSSEYIVYDDNYAISSDIGQVSVSLSNDNYGIEIDSFDPEEFLDALCSGGKMVTIHGNVFDIDDEEYRFISNIGETSYVNTDDIDFSDELDDEAKKENGYDDYD